MSQDPDDSSKVRHQLREIWWRTIRAAGEILIEFAVASFVLLAIASVQGILFWLRGGDLILFEGSKLEFSLRWIFEAADLTVFLFFAVSTVVRTFKIIIGHYDE
jgi:hypothetical protein